MLQISTLSKDYSHWRAVKSLSDWLKENNVPGIRKFPFRATPFFLHTAADPGSRLTDVADSPHVSHLKHN